MPAKKMRVELFDSEGNKYTVAFEGQVTRDKALRLLDLVELLGGMPNDSAAQSTGQSIGVVNPSRIEKVRSLVQKNFPLIWFSSRDVQTAYEQELKEPVTLSTVSTYLSRMSGKGWLTRAGEGNNLKYKLAPSIPLAKIKQQNR
jgi:hypothetical protein